ncbi:iron-sulfur cluster assembly accessory protein [Aliifodinibius sp. S!AR15-10]|uniref:HesB/IscA family protein n=1 Tax=Aliifodinibius sp. S!AR15-10 TaxID=2950437 RepID=UPI0028567D4E|nr:iron-sulfur cluster assembly accessory protein [Aliifodinibius sp. S!AR15-10]MDR8394374.1 iron-sulfur cluster assembly accessory protein [Aliifodinibius sp. S!AR15-10]
MPAGQDDDLDSVISDLIDVDDDTSDEQAGESAFSGIDTSKTTTEGTKVSLTERAARQVRKIKEDEDLDDELFLRMAVEGGGCSGLSYKLGFDFKTDDDAVFESHDIEIIVDKKHLMYLEGISIDYPDGLDARGFTFDNPNAEETCGCGSSFAT